MASVKVAVRVRPMNRREKDLEAKFIIQMEKSKTTITNLKIPEGGTGDTGRERTKTFTYDFSFYSADTKSPDYISQEMVFKTLGTDVVKSAFEGYNACVFAYGQTGSGKSYTMMGNSGDSGLIPRICEGLFSRINETTRWDEASFRTEVSYLEIYNERVRDLLRRKSSKTFNLRVREHPKEGPYVEDLSKHLVQNYGDVEELMDAGNINRTTAATGMNDVSSRSHAIFTIKFTQAKFDSEMPCETVSKIHLVDLAGSERADATGATGVRLKEGGNINKSLVTLGNVISALADLSQDAANPLVKKKQVFVPYRDSVLTWLLKDSLGGNSKTIMIATISPADVNYGETLSTLRYANRAKNIINKPTINEDANVKLIRELRAEIARLKALLAQGNQIALLDSPTALSMEEKLHQNEARVQELTKEWTNKWNETQNILKEQTLALRKEGIGVVLDSELPHLIGIDDDLLSTGIILYHLKEGQTYVGREDASTEQDIVLHGLDLESEHCVFENVGGTVTLIPLSGSQCSVNGVQIMEATHLNQGAVILLGRTNMFRFNHPKEAAKLREKRKSGLLSSFSLSMTDLSKSCENLSAVMLYNPGLEFERQQREELEKLESKRKLIEEMEEKQKSDKAALERMQQEVETQRKETEIVQRQIRKQEESLKRRSFHIENKFKDLLAEKEKFEEERLREQQEIELQKKRQEEESLLRIKEELQRLQELNNSEQAEKVQISQELDRLHREKDEQCAKLELEKRRLEEEEKEQVLLVAHLEEQLREKQQMTPLLQLGEVQRVEEEKKDLEGIREALLQAREAQAGGDKDGEELEKAQLHFLEFKRRQFIGLAKIEKDLIQQKDLLRKAVQEEQKTLKHLKYENHEVSRLAEANDGSVPNVTGMAEDLEKIKPAEYRLQYKERQLQYLLQKHLPALLEEKKKVLEILDQGTLGLDNTLYQVEKEMEEKEEQLAQYQTRASELQQLQATFEFTANVARQEDKVRKKEKEILESQEKQQREALERAVAKLERRRSALQRHSTLGLEIQEQRQKLATLRGSSSGQAGLHAGLEAEQEALEKDRERLEHEIQQLKQKICDVDGIQRDHCGTLEGKTAPSSLPSSAEKSPLAPLMDARISAYIEEEVQRRLQDLHRALGDASNTSADMMKDNEKLHNGTIQRKLKYEKRQLQPTEYIASLLTKDATDTSIVIREERREVDQSNSWNHPMTHGILGPEAASSISQDRRDPSSVAEPLQDYGYKYCHLELSGHLEPKYFHLLHKSCTRDTDAFQGKPENISELMNHEDEHSLGVESSWTPLQHTSQQVSINSRSKQAKHSRVLCFVLSQESTSQEQSTSGCALQSTGALASRWEQQDEKELAAKKISSPASLINIGAEGNNALGYFYHRFSDLYKDTSSHLLQAGTKVISQAKHMGSLCDPNGLTSQVTTFMRRLPFLRHLPLDVPWRSSIAPSGAHSYSNAQTTSNSEEAGNPTLPDSPGPYTASAFTAVGLSNSLPSSVFHLEYEDAPKISVFKQSFIQFPDLMLQLQGHCLDELLQHVTCLLPQPADHMKDVKGIYWLAVANCTEPDPQPACLLLLSSALYAMVQSGPSPGSMSIFHALPLSALQEIQVSFGGQSIRLLGSAASLLTVFTYNKKLCQQLCWDLLCVLLSESEAATYADHPLFQQDLVELSLDCMAEVPDLVVANGVRLSSQFQATGVDMVYFLHGNMEGSIPSLAEVQLLLYTTVRVEGEYGCRACQSLVLLNTHIALLREDRVFYPHSWSLNTLPPRTQFEVIRCHALSEFRSVVVPEKKNLPTVELIFIGKLGLAQDSRNNSPAHLQDPPSASLFTAPICLRGAYSEAPEVWKLTFNSQDEALWLTSYLTRLKQGDF
ncbi:kinesin-like protein KIF16B isoform X2 [Perognathus longimembris pacificus]|uniref:kinesin-like protein KIF16B isoform X2 n=1 Tax=Perognathus longimembris pacificus TaxID=214514 RepID=UPI002018BB42|nr:kinesin-like protein KIF16B isoform X2 [Perognathus longimembris pacificus]